MSQEDDGFNTSGFIIYHGAMGETIIIDRFLNISRRYNDALSLDSELSPPRAPFSTRRFGQIPSIAFPADEAPDAQCVICLAPFQPGEEVKELLCHHKFHSECLEPWLRERQHCPLCRNAVSVGSISSENEAVEAHSDGSSWLSDTTGLSHTDSHFSSTAEERQYCPLCRNEVSVGSISSENEAVEAHSDGSSWLNDTTGLSHTDSHFSSTAEERQYCPLCRNEVSVGSISSENEAVEAHSDGSSWLSDTTGLSHTDSHFFSTAEEFSIAEAHHGQRHTHTLNHNSHNHIHNYRNHNYRNHNYRNHNYNTHNYIRFSVNIYCDMDSVLSTDTDWSDGA
ncbi:hypothetical protein M8J75_015739 [Diaphorina citri]|nr:hypothetical protein M8J75_015739 [Diaphorina citri]